MDLAKNIRSLRIYAIVLFILPTVALLGSIFLHNYLVSYKYTHLTSFNFTEFSPGSSIKFKCDESNNYCKKIILKKDDTLGQCIPNKVTRVYVDGKDQLIKELGDRDIRNPNFSIDEIIKNNDEIYEKFEISNSINEECIKNSFEYKIYKVFPFVFEKITSLKSNGLPLGTSYEISPFLKGDTSISNIVKRFPINFFFKSLIYLSVIFMVYYWIFYNKIFKNLNNYNKNYIFFRLGILSAVFLFLHTFFLGWTFESEFLTKLRRTFVVFFILFEVLAQAFLIRKILLLKKQISSYINIKIAYSKLFFVASICLTTIIILIILLNYNLEAKIDYILEWNYFLVLLFFYFLSFLMWKRNH